MNVRTHVKRWVVLERALYADVKYAEDTVGRERLIVDAKFNPHLTSPLDEAGPWVTFISNYTDRVHVFGLHTPQGRQALGKLIATLTHLLETAVMVHGPMPLPGKPSGEIKEWVGARK